MWRCDLKGEGEGGGEGGQRIKVGIEVLKWVGTFIVLVVCGCILLLVIFSSSVKVSVRMS